MEWITIAEGEKLDDIAQLVADRELPKGTPVRFEMTLNMPVAHLFDLAGAEHIFKSMMPEGLDLIDVSSPDNQYEVVIDCESDPVHIVAIVAFVKAHWLAISLISIGIVLALGALVIAIKVKSPKETLSETKWIFIALAAIAVIVLIGFLAYRGFIPKVT